MGHAIIWGRHSATRSDGGKLWTCSKAVYVEEGSGKSGMSAMPCVSIQCVEGVYAVAGDRFDGRAPIHVVYSHTRGTEHIILGKHLIVGILLLGCLLQDMIEVIPSTSIAEYLQPYNPSEVCCGADRYLMGSEIHCGSPCYRGHVLNHLESLLRKWRATMSS